MAGKFPLPERPEYIPKDKWGRAGCAIVPGIFPVPGRPANFDNVGRGPTALAVGAGGGCFDMFLLSITTLFFLPLSGRRPDID